MFRERCAAWVTTLTAKDDGTENIDDSGDVV
jgi:hypothetical protein